jgi:hypothetical protein
MDLAHRNLLMHLFVRKDGSLNKTAPVHSKTGAVSLFILGYLRTDTCYLVLD